MIVIGLIPPLTTASKVALSPIQIAISSSSVKSKVVLVKVTTTVSLSLQPKASVNVITYCPAPTLFQLAAAGPPFHLKLYGLVPADAVADKSTRAAQVIAVSLPASTMGNGLNVYYNRITIYTSIYISTGNIIGCFYCRSSCRICYVRII